MGRGEKPRLHVFVAVQEHLVVRHRLFDELFYEEQLRAVDDGVNALLKSLQRREGLKTFAKQNHGGMATLVHGHLLERLQREVFLHAVGGEAFFENHDLVVNLAEADEKVAVRGRRVDLVAQLLKGGLASRNLRRC